MALKYNFFLLLFLTKQFGQLLSYSWKTIELYRLCLFGDDDIDVGDFVDTGGAVEDGPKVVWFGGPSKVLLAIPKECLEL